VEIVSLHPEAFRNLARARVDFHPRVNLIVGDNGHGKTNLLEALALVSGRASFRSNDLSIVRQNDAARSVLSARLRAFAPDGGPRPPEGTLGAVLADGQREHFWEGRKISRLAASRLLPAVFLTARDLVRLSGPPADRRRALDRAALSLEREYARTLQAYEKARASKHRLLALKNRFDADEFAVYESVIAEAGGRIAATRRRVVGLLGAELARHAGALGSPFGGLTLDLISDLPAEGTPAVFAETLRAAMRERKTDERRAGRCLVGPHRDDVLLRSEGVPVATRASSGENRTFVLAWTLAEMSLAAAELPAAPLLAFDDFDSEWDPGVLAAFAEGLPDAGQVFLASARPEAVRGLPLPHGALYRMVSGQLTREGILGAGRATGRSAARAGER
jgi:DNA replication and repair protein RecF